MGSNGQQVAAFEKANDMSVCYISPMKTCTKCGEEKPLEAFTPNKKASHGVNNWCRPCYNAYGAAYYAKTKETRRAQANARRAASAEKHVAKNKAWREANPDYYRKRYEAQRDVVKERSRRRYWADPQSAIRAAGEWAKKNPEKARANGAKRHARKLGATGRGVSGADIARVLAESLGLCAYCNERKPLTVDHIEPLARGGRHDVDNLVAACKSCNCSKKARALVVWLAERAAA